MKKEVKSFLSGVAFLIGPFLVFLVLKLTNLVTWSWWWITSPLWIVAALVVVLALISFCVIAFRVKKH